MKSDTSVGLNKADFGNRLRDLNFAYEEVAGSNVGPESFRKSAKEAVDIYKDIDSLWGVKILVPGDGELYYGKVRGVKGGAELWQFKGQSTAEHLDPVTVVNSVFVIRGLYDGEKRGSIDEAIALLMSKASEQVDEALSELK